MALMLVDSHDLGLTSVIQIWRSGDVFAVDHQKTRQANHITRFEWTARWMSLPLIRVPPVEFKSKRVKTPRLKRIWA